MRRMVVAPAVVLDNRRPPCGGLYWQMLLLGDVLLIGIDRPYAKPPDNDRERHDGHQHYQADGKH